MPTRPPQKKDHPPAVSEEVLLVIYAALLASWIGLLLWSSLASHLPSVPRVLSWDKLHHFLAYAILMLFSGLFLKTLLKNRLKGWSIGFVFTISFGLLMEIGQATLATNRHADWKDFIANSLGAGLIFALALLKRNKGS
jgi:VanZ family protein